MSLYCGGVDCEGEIENAYVDVGSFAGDVCTSELPLRGSPELAEIDVINDLRKYTQGSGTACSSLTGFGQHPPLPHYSYSNPPTVALVSAQAQAQAHAQSPAPPVPPAAAAAAALTEAQNDVLKNQVAILKDQNDYFLKTFSELNESLSSSEATVALLRKEIIQLSSALASETKLKKSYASRSSSLERELEELKLSQRRSLFKMKKDFMASAESDAKDAIKEHDKLKAEVRKQRDEAYRYEEIASKLRAQCKKLKFALGEAEIVASKKAEEESRSLLNAMRESFLRHSLDEKNRLDGAMSRMKDSTVPIGEHVELRAELEHTKKQLAAAALLAAASQKSEYNGKEEDEDEPSSPDTNMTANKSGA